MLLQDSAGYLSKDLFVGKRLAGLALYRNLDLPERKDPAKSGVWAGEDLLHFSYGPTSTTSFTLREDNSVAPFLSEGGGSDGRKRARSIPQFHECSRQPQ